MTGEMFKEDVTRERYPLYFKIADALGGTVEPFDRYQGPYILIGQDVRVGDAPYAGALHGLGIVRLWVIDQDNGIEAAIYNEANGKTSDPFPWDCDDLAVDAARSVL